MNRDRLNVVALVMFVSGAVVVGVGIILRGILANRAEVQELSNGLTESWGLTPDAVPAVWPGWVVIGLGAALMLVAVGMRVVWWITEPE